MALPYALNPFGVNKNKTPLTFTAMQNSSWVRLSYGGSVDYSGIKYRIGTSGDWMPYPISTLIYLSEGENVQFMNTKSTLCLSTINYFNFGCGGKVKASGNLQSMLNYIENAPTNCFIYLFTNNKNLVQPPEMPAKTLGNLSCRSMFQGCTSLIKTPVLPANNIGIDCYRSMFQGCTSLINISKINAPQMSNNACYSMFQGCTALTSAFLPANTLGNYTCARMFYGCTALTSVKLNATTLGNNACRNMFTNCSSLNSVEVNFTDWNTEGTATANWFGGNPIDGTFIKPIALPEQRGGSRIPTGWAVINK